MIGFGGGMGGQTLPSGSSSSRAMMSAAEMFPEQPEKPSLFQQLVQALLTGRSSSWPTASISATRPGRFRRWNR